MRVVCGTNVLFSGALFGGNCRSVVRLVSDPDPAASTPLWYADDPEATVLGRAQANGKAGLVVRRFADWTSVYSAAPLTCPGVLRALARAAGVHLYCDRDDALYVNNRYLGIHAQHGGRRTVRSPFPVIVTDLWTGDLVVSHRDQLTIELPQYATGVYEYRAAPD